MGVKWIFVIVRSRTFHSRREHRRNKNEEAADWKGAPETLPNAD